MSNIAQEQKIVKVVDVEQITENQFQKKKDKLIDVPGRKSPLIAIPHTLILVDGGVISVGRKCFVRARQRAERHLVVEEYEPKRFLSDEQNAACKKLLDDVLRVTYFYELLILSPLGLDEQVDMLPVLIACAAAVTTLEVEPELVGLTIFHMRPAIEEFIRSQFRYEPFLNARFEVSIKLTFQSLFIFQWHSRFIEDSLFREHQLWFVRTSLHDTSNGDAKRMPQAMYGCLLMQALQSADSDAIPDVFSRFADSPAMLMCKNERVPKIGFVALNLAKDYSLIKEFEVQQGGYVLLVEKNRKTGSELAWASKIAKMIAEASDERIEKVTFEQIRTGTGYLHGLQDPIEEFPETTRIIVKLDR